MPARASSSTQAPATQPKAKPTTSAKRQRAEAPQPSAILEPPASSPPRPKTPPKAPPCTRSAPGSHHLRRSPECRHGDRHPKQQPCRPALSRPIGIVWPLRKVGILWHRRRLILTTRSGRQLWLAGIPIAETVQHFPKTNLQIACLPQYPEGRGGVTLPQAFVAKVQMSSKRMDSEFRAVWPLIHQSLHCGDSVLVHCTAGKHRAPACSALIFALLMGVSVDEAAAEITCVEFHKFCRDRTAAQWLYKTRRSRQYMLDQLDIWCRTCTEGRIALCAFKQGRHAPSSV